MARKPRLDLPGRTFHLMNRSVGRLQLFNNPQDYLLFMSVFREAWEITPIDIYAYCVMPNHFHILGRGYAEGDVSSFMHALSSTYTRRLHQQTGTVGNGPVFQGRFKSVLVQDEHAFNTMLRYIELNPVRAKLVERARLWEWSSAYVKTSGNSMLTRLLAQLPDDIPSDITEYEEWLEGGIGDAEVAQIREAIQRGRPYGNPNWVDLMIKEHNLVYTMRRDGRPVKE